MNFIIEDLVKILEEHPVDISQFLPFDLNYEHYFNYLQKVLEDNGIRCFFTQIKKKPKKMTFLEQTTNHKIELVVCSKLDLLTVREYYTTDTEKDINLRKKSIEASALIYQALQAYEDTKDRKETYERIRKNLLGRLEEFIEKNREIQMRRRIIPLDYC